jgi:hypothetical protein
MSFGASSPEWEHWRRKLRTEFCRVGTRPDLAGHLEAQATGPSCLTSAMLSETSQEEADQSGISDAIGHTLTILNSADKDHSRTLEIQRRPYVVSLHYGPTCRGNHRSVSGI